MNKSIHDLRTAIDFLKTIPGEVITISKPVSLDCEMASVYHEIGARGTTIRPTKTGPVVIFDNIKERPGAKVCYGMVGARERVGHILGEDPKRLGQFYLDCVNRPVKPEVVSENEAVCREEVYLASDPDFDLFKILPAPMTTPTDAGKFITMGLVYASDPDDPNSKNAAIHRICLQGRDLMTVGIGGHRHLADFRDKAFAKGENLKVSVSIGIDPAVYLASCFEPPTTPIGFDELTIAGAMRGAAVKLVKCKTVDEYCIANAEYVIEGELVSENGKPVMMMEDSTTGSGRALPEFPGYQGKVRPCQVLKVTAVTCRHDPVMLCCIGASDEHVNMAGIPNEASILNFCEKALPGTVKNAYCPPSGGGKFNAILQISKKDPRQEGNQIQAALGALATLPETKNIILVDDDVDIFDPYDVEWALTTRFRPDKDLKIISGAPCHLGDPTEKKYYDPLLPRDGIAYKAIYDATCPFEYRDEMRRPRFSEVNLQDYLDQ